MQSRKTRIWNRATLDALREAIPRTSAPPSLPAVVTAPARTAVAAPVSVVAAASCPPQPSGPAAPHAPQGPRPAGFGRATLVGHRYDLERLAGASRYGRGKQQADGMSSTRLVPIESLLKPPAPESAVSESSAPAQPAAAPSAPPSRKLGLSAVHARRGLMAVLGLFAMSTWLVGSLRGAEPVTPVPRLPVVAVAAGSPRRAPDHDATTTHAAPVAPGGAPFDQRRAVDALASGDFAAAQRLYGALARSVEGPSAYAEAARILDERLRGGRP